MRFLNLTVCSSAPNFLKTKIWDRTLRVPNGNMDTVKAIQSHTVRPDNKISSFVTSLESVCVCVCVLY